MAGATIKHVRKHSGIRQSGPKKGTLKKGYKYVSGEVNYNGMTKIVKVPTSKK